EEPAARPDDGRHRADVVAAAGGIDRAVARVLPDAVEGVGGLASEREDVALLEFDLHAVAPGQGAGRGDRGRREVVADHLVAARGEESRVVATAAAQHGDPPARRRRLLHEIDERRRRLSQLPAVTARRVQSVPEVRRVYTGHANPSKSAMARSAPAASSSRTL